jgi:hypothetical protein
MGFGRETSTLALYICSFAIELFLLVLLVFMVTATVVMCILVSWVCRFQFVGVLNILVFETLLFGPLVVVRKCEI